MKKTNIDRSLEEIASEMCLTANCGETFGPYRVNQQIFGLKDGLYVPIGEIRLPIQVHSFVDENSNNLRCVEIVTLFRDDFMEDPQTITYTKDDRSMPYGISVEEAIINAQKLELSQQGWQERLENDLKVNPLFTIGDSYMGLSPKEVLIRHIEDFFKVYSIAMKIPANQSSARITRRFFNEY